MSITTEIAGQAQRHKHKDPFDYSFLDSPNECVILDAENGKKQNSLIVEREKGEELKQNSKQKNVASKNQYLVLFER